MDLLYLTEAIDESVSHRELSRIFRDHVVAFRLRTRRLEVTPHTHSESFSIKTVFSGIERYQFEEREIGVRPSEALLVPPGRTYGSSIRTSELTDSFSVFFPSWWLQTIVTNAPAEHVDRLLERGGPLVSLPLTAETSSSLREFAETLTQADGDRLAAQETLAVLTHRIFLLAEAAGELAGRIHATNPSTRLELLRRVSRVRDLLESRVQSGVSLTELSREACLSEFHLLRVFKQAFGTTPARYLERRRMERARDLLHATGLPIAEVAASCGYSNLSAFGRAFRRAWGTSATSLRDERSAAPVRLTS